MLHVSVTPMSSPSGTRPSRLWRSAKVTQVLNGFVGLNGVKCVGPLHPVFGVLLNLIAVIEQQRDQQRRCASSSAAKA